MRLLLCTMASTFFTLTPLKAVFSPPKKLACAQHLGTLSALLFSFIIPIYWPCLIYSLDGVAMLSGAVFIRSRNSSRSFLEASAASCANLSCSLLASAGVVRWLIRSRYSLLISILASSFGALAIRF